MGWRAWTTKERRGNRGREDEGGRRNARRFLGEGWVEKTKKSDDGQRPGQKVKTGNALASWRYFPTRLLARWPRLRESSSRFRLVRKGRPPLPRPRAAHHPAPRHETPRRRARDRRRAAPLSPLGASPRLVLARSERRAALARVRRGRRAAPPWWWRGRAAPLGRALGAPRVPGEAVRRRRERPPEHRPDAERADAGRVRLRHERGVPGVPRGPVQGGSEQRPRVLGLAPEADGCVGATPAPSTRARPPERRPDPIDTTPRPRRRPTRPRPGVPRRPSLATPAVRWKKSNIARDARRSKRPPSWWTIFFLQRFLSFSPAARPPSLLPSPRRHHRPSPSPPLSLPPIITLSHQTPA